MEFFVIKERYGFFIAEIALFSIIKDKNIVLKNIIIGGIICIVAVILNLLQIKLVGRIFNLSSWRMGGIKYVPYMLMEIITKTPGIMINTAGIFPKFMFVGYIIITFVFVGVIKQKNLICNLIVFFVITFCATFAMNLFTIASYGCARLMYPLGALLGNMFILIYMKAEINNINFKYIFAVIATTYTIAILVNYMAIIKQHKEVEKLTIKECEIIKSYIDKYESETGIKVKYIAVYDPQYVTPYYKEIKNKSQLCYRPLAFEWSDNGSINYWNNIRLEQIEPSKSIYYTYFYNKRWDKLDKEQFLFVGDEMHYCIY